MSVLWCTIYQFNTISMHHYARRNNRKWQIAHESIDSSSKTTITRKWLQADQPTADISLKSSKIHEIFFFSPPLILTARNHLLSALALMENNMQMMCCIKTPVHNMDFLLSGYCECYNAIMMLLFCATVFNIKKRTKKKV